VDIHPVKVGVSEHAETIGDIMKQHDEEHRYNIALGKLLAERAQIDPDKVSEDWDARYNGGATSVSVTLRIPMSVPRAEFDALVKRAGEAGK